MPEPAVSATTERLYDRLPEHYRNADQDAAGDYPLKRYLSLVVDQEGEVETLLDRLDYVPADEGGDGGASDLVDPLTAENRWLDWLAQHVGALLEPVLTEAERRDAVSFAPGGWRSGNKQAIRDAARTELTGTKYAAVYDHSTDASAIGAAGEWDVLVVTRPSETPAAAAVLEAIRRKRAKPAGVLLYWKAYEASWDTIEANLATWDAIEAAGSWDQIQETGLA